MKKYLKVFDFDGTLVFTPSPQSLINGLPAIQLYDQWLNQNSLPLRKWKGWWGRVESLTPPVFGQFKENQLTFPQSSLNHTLAEIHNQCFQDPENLVVLMTGRNPKMFCPYTGSHAVKQILDYFSLAFHRYYYTCNLPVFDFKCQKIIDVLNEFPSIREIQMWEDQPLLYEKFLLFLRELQSQNKIDAFSVNLIPGDYQNV